MLHVPGFIDARKNYSLFALLLVASYMQKTNEFEFSSLAEEI